MNSENCGIRVYPKWIDCIKRGEIRLCEEITAGFFFVRKMKLLMHGESNRKLLIK
jgi:hypothetical protein